MFGLSDAIIGLTVFAMGNSIGDWVANATVAVSHPKNVKLGQQTDGPSYSHSEHGITPDGDFRLLWWTHAQHSTRIRSIGILYDL